MKLKRERRGVTSPVTPCCNNFSRCSWVQIGASFIFRFGFFNSIQVRSQMMHGERLYPTKDIYSGGSCSNTDSLPAILLRILLKVSQNNFIKQRTKYYQPEPKNNRKVFIVVTNVCELLIYACESKEYCGELLKLSTEHNK